MGVTEVYISPANFEYFDFFVCWTPGKKVPKGPFQKLFRKFLKNNSPKVSASLVWTFLETNFNAWYAQLTKLNRVILDQRREIYEIREDRHKISTENKALRLENIKLAKAIQASSRRFVQLQKVPVVVKTLTVSTSNFVEQCHCCHLLRKREFSPHTNCEDLPRKHSSTKTTVDRMAMSYASVAALKKKFAPTNKIVETLPLKPVRRWFLAVGHSHGVEFKRPILGGVTVLRRESNNAFVCYVVDGIAYSNSSSDWGFLDEDTSGETLISYKTASLVHKCNCRSTCSCAVLSERIDIRIGDVIVE